MEPGCGSLDLTFDWYQRYWICLQQSKSRRRSTCLRVESTSIRTSLYCPSQYCRSKKPSFHSYDSPMDTHLIRISKYWFSVMQCQHILMQELYCMRAEPEVYCLISILLHTEASLKAVLPFDFVNTSGQKSSTLHAHFTHPYWALHALPNHFH